MSDSRISPSPLLEGRGSGPMIITATTPPSRLSRLVPGLVVKEPDASVQGRAAGGHYFQRSPPAAAELLGSNCGYSGRRLSPDSHLSEIIPESTSLINAVLFASKSDISPRASWNLHQTRMTTRTTTSIDEAPSRQAPPPLRPVPIKLATKPSAATETMMRAWHQHPEASFKLSGQAAGPFLGSSDDDEAGRLVIHQYLIPKKLNPPMTLMTSSSPPLGPGTFCTHPSARRYPTSLSTSSRSSESSRSGKTVTSDCLMRQTQSTAVSDKNTAGGTAFRRSSHLKRHRGFLPSELQSLGSAATESEEQSSLDEKVNGDHHLRQYRCWRRRMSQSSSQRHRGGSEDFRLPGEPRRSAARWRNNQCLQLAKPDFKYGNVVSGHDMETASTKRRRVTDDGDGDGINVEPRRLTSLPEEPASVTTAAPIMLRRRLIDAFNNQADDAIGTETKRQHTNAAVIARTTKKR